MFLYENKTELNSQVKDTLSYLANNIEFQNLRKTNLLKLLEEVSTNIEKLTDFDNPSELLSVLDDLKSSLNKVRYNIDKLNELNLLLDGFKAFTSESFNVTKIEEYNNLSCKYEREILENDLYIEHFLNRYISFVPQFYSQIKDTTESTTIDDFQIKDTAESTVIDDDSHPEILEDNISDLDTNQTEIPQDEVKKVENFQNDIEEVENEELLDNNTLLISETKGKVFLPYKIDNLKNILKKSDKYNSLDELITDQYILPISRFKSPMISRFKEAFYLMKNKEKAPLLDCLSLALELSTNTYLNPAIITACENVDQLDIYLDYLEDDELEKFDIFKIEYEILPTKK